MAVCTKPFDGAGRAWTPVLLLLASFEAEETPSDYLARVCVLATRAQRGFVVPGCGSQETRGDQRPSIDHGETKVTCQEASSSFSLPSRDGACRNARAHTYGRRCTCLTERRLFTRPQNAVENEPSRKIIATHSERDASRQTLYKGQVSLTWFLDNHSSVSTLDELVTVDLRVIFQRPPFNHPWCWFLTKTCNPKFSFQKTCIGLPEKHFNYAGRNNY